MTDAAPVRIGLVGYGFGGRYFHAPLLASAPNCVFAGVVTTSEPTARAGRPRAPRRAAVRLAGRPAAAGAEAVAISTPAATHSALTDEALELGLAVVCDKPFALDAAAARATPRSRPGWGSPSRRTRTGAGTPTS